MNVAPDHQSIFHLKSHTVRWLIHALKWPVQDKADACLVTGALGPKLCVWSITALGVEPDAKDLWRLGKMNRECVTVAGVRSTCTAPGATLLGLGGLWEVVHPNGRGDRGEGVCTTKIDRTT